MAERIVIIQTCLPDYRLPLIERILAIAPGAHVVFGREYFTTGVVVCGGPIAGCSYLTNHFLLRKSLLWQSGALKRSITAEIAVVEFNPRILSTWWILFRRRLRNRPTLLWGHLWGRYGSGPLSRCARLIMLRLSQGMICYTRRQAEELKRVLPGHLAWAAPNSCVPRTACFASSLPRKAHCVAYIGRLIKSKKPDILLEAFARAAERLPPEAQLILAGNGEQRDVLRRRIGELGLTGRVEMPGHVGDENALKEIYARSCVAVSPGYVGLSAIQCMASGVPMIVSRHESHSPEIEACVEEKTCVFFETDKVESLAEKIIQFYQADSPWPGRRAKIAAFIAQNYTYEGMIEGFTAAFDAMRLQARGIGHLTTALVWAQFGPYHLARLAALKRVLGLNHVLGIEIANRTSTYDWKRDASATEVITLIKYGTAEQASALDVYRSSVQAFRQRNVGVVFVPSYWPASSLAVLLAARTVGAKVVMMNDSHGHTVKAKGILAAVKRSLVRKFDAALVAGAPQKEYFSSLGLNGAKIVLGYDAVDNAYFMTASREARTQADMLRARYALPKRYFINVGRMEWKKNLEALVDAYQLVRGRLGDNCPRLVLVGSGRLEDALHKRCVQYGLTVLHLTSAVRQTHSESADVLFMGFRQVQDLPAFYALASAFVLPSREEEWGLVVNEAMACGLPVLVSKVAGCARDLVKEGENGFLFDPFDANELAGHLERIAREPELAAKMGRASERLIADWGCERFAEGARKAVKIAMGDQMSESDGIGNSALGSEDRKAGRAE